MAVGEGRDGRHFADQAEGLLFARLGTENVFRVVIVGGERGDGGNHHAHGVGVVVKAIEEFFDALVNEGVVGDVIGPVFQLAGGGKLAVEQEVGGFGIGAFFSEIFDGVAAVTEDAGVAVDIGDFADAGRGVVEGRVVGHHAEIGGVELDLAQVGGADGAVGDGNFVGFAGAIVGDGERFAGLGSRFGLFCWR